MEQKGHICPNCGYENAKTSLRCMECKHLLDDIPAINQYIHIQRPEQTAQDTNNSFRPSSVRVRLHTLDKRTKLLIGCIPILLLLILISNFVFRPLMALFHVNGGNKSSVQGGFTPPSFARGIGHYKAPDGEEIGISDGSFAFDTGSDRRNVTAKLNAASANDISTAASLWEAAVAQDPRDAESHIYYEDSRVLASGHPYITVVVCVALAPTPDYLGLYTLQGAYVAQKEYNDGHQLPNNFAVRLLIARSGHDTAYVPWITKQISDLAKADQTVVGVTGFPDTSRTINEVPGLTKARIPMISSLAAGDILKGISRYFFRTVAANSILSVNAAMYAEENLKKHKAAVFMAPKDDFSVNLAEDFQKAFSSHGDQVVAQEKFVEGQSKDFPQLIADALQHNPDIILIGSITASDVQALLAGLPTEGPFANLQVISSAIGTSLINYPDSQRKGFQRLHIVSLSYPDTWEILGHGNEKPKFFDDYKTAFYDSENSAVYGSVRPDTYATLSYDATLTLLSACSLALTGKQHITPDDVRDALTQIKGAKAVQGAGGQVSFDSDNEPTQKAVIIISVRPDHTTYLDTIEGCFLKGCPK